MDISKLRKKIQERDQQAQEPKETTEVAQEASAEVPVVAPDVDTSQTDDDEFEAFDATSDEEDEFLASPNETENASKASAEDVPIASAIPSLLCDIPDAAEAIPSLRNVVETLSEIELPDNGNEPYDEYDDFTNTYAGDDGDLLGRLSEELIHDDFVEYLSFRVFGEPYVLRIARVKEIIRPRVLTKLPRSPEELRGILAMRGEMIPVIDLRIRLGLQEALLAEEQNNDLELEPRIVVLSRGDYKLGLYVDRIIGVIRLDENEFSDPASIQGSRENRVIQAIGLHDGGFVIVLDVDQFFSEDET